MKFTTILSLISIFPITVTYAQNTLQELSTKTADSLKMVYLSNTAIRYPLLRQGFISSEFLGKGRVDAKLDGRQLYKGESQVTRIKSVFNIPVLKFGKNRISSSISYLQQHVDVTQVEGFKPEFPVADYNYNRSTIGLTATFIRTDSIFNRSVVYSGSISGLTDRLSKVRRFNYIGIISLNLKRTPTTSYSIGAAVILDPSSPSPFLPLFNYWHKFTSSDLELFFEVPSRILLRKQFSNKAWLSFGTELNGTLAFFSPDKTMLPQDFTHTTIELKTGPTFEYLLSKKIIIGLNGGLLTTASSRFFRKTDHPDNYFLNNNNSSVPFLSFSISFLPFIKALN